MAQCDGKLRKPRSDEARRSGVFHWVGTDHLGSTIRVADVNFNAVDGMRYLPYGGSRDAGTNLQTDHLFTSQVLDASIGLYWYNSRAYDPVLGRFLVPDTIVPNAMNPQSLNRYSYGRNNPLRYTDPS
ncbi:MAG: RHS repeat-associated core domain-containing protein [Chloroflexota bacterium]|nr:MAG: RHS repeat-associated core domain-containing protein [Chloroflexota bacterium]